MTSHFTASIVSVFRLTSSVLFLSSKLDLCQLFFVTSIHISVLAKACKMSHYLMAHHPFLLNSTELKQIQKNNLATKCWITTIATTVMQDSLVKVYDTCGYIYMYDVLPHTIYCGLFQSFITYKQQTMLIIDFTQQSFWILHFTTNYHTRGCILVEDLSPYNILRSCPTTLAVAQVLCSHVKSFQGHYFDIPDTTKWTMYKGEVVSTGIMFIPSDMQFLN